MATKKLQAVPVPLNKHIEYGDLIQHWEGMCLLYTTQKIDYAAWKPIALYWVSNDPIQEGDWYIWYKDNSIVKADKNWKFLLEGFNCAKVVAATQKLEGVLPISPEDIQAYADSPYDKVEVKWYPGCSQIRQHVEVDRMGHPIRVLSQIERSFKALDRAYDKMGKEGLEKIIKSIPNIPGPTLDEYLTNMSNPTPVWKKIDTKDWPIGRVAALNIHGQSIVSGFITHSGIGDHMTCTNNDNQQYIVTHYMPIELLLSLPVEEE